MRLKVDLHTHILPRQLPDMKSRSGYGGWPDLQWVAADCADIVIDGKFFRRVYDNCFSPERRIEECDRANVAIQVLSTVPVMFSYWARPEHTEDLARYLNDQLAEVVSKYPERFIGLGTVPLQDPTRAAVELRRCKQDLGFPGVQIATHVNDWNLDEAELRPFFAEAERLGACIFVHPWDMMGANTMPKYFMPWLVGMPAETSRAACSLIFGGVLEEFPNLRIALAHGGGSFPFTLGRIDRGFAGRPDLCQVHIQRPPSTYARRLYVDALVHDARALRFLLELFGPERVALGSDYPFPLGEKEPGALIESAGLDDATRRWLLRDTALQFLGQGEPEP